jgi:hypothetical protein
MRLVIFSPPSGALYHASGDFEPLRRQLNRLPGWTWLPTFHIPRNGFRKTGYKKRKIGMETCIRQARITP